jgi:hypothetical protein
MRKLISWKTMVIQIAAFAFTAGTQGVVCGQDITSIVPNLTVIVSPEQQLTLTPKVTIQGQQSESFQLEHEKDSPYWKMPLKHDPGKLITPYVVAITQQDAHIVAIRIDFPSSLERENQTVVLQPPKVKNADDRTVGNYWSEDFGEVLKNPNDIRTLLRTLQDLHFFVSHHQAEPSSAAPSAPHVRAAFMLLKVVQSLAQKTWYVVADDYQKAVDHGAMVLSKVKRKNACSWLGQPSCEGIDDMLKRQQNLEGLRLGRIHDLIVPQGSIFSPPFCDDMRIRNLENYYTYFASKADSTTSEYMRTGSGVSEVRVANELAACIVTRATCDQSYQERTKKMLEEAKNRLVDAKLRFKDQRAAALADKRIAEVSEILSAMAEGKPTTCSH